MVKDSGSLQRALTGVDQQLQRLQQQQPPGSVMAIIGQKLSAAAAAAAATAGAVGAAAHKAAGGAATAAGTSSVANGTAPYTLGCLEPRLRSLQAMKDVVDPCRHLMTPGWPSLAADLDALAGSAAAGERQSFVTALGSVLTALRMRYCGGATPQQLLQQHPGCEQQQQHAEQVEEYELVAQGLAPLLEALRVLANDSVPGVRCGVAALATGLLLAQQSCSQTSDSVSNTCATQELGATMQAAGSNRSGLLPCGHAPGHILWPADAEDVLRACLERLRLDGCATVAGVAAGSMQHAAATADGAALTTTTTGSSDSHTGCANGDGDGGGSINTLQPVKPTAPLVG
jgi:hypothetical protein